MIKKVILGAALVVGALLGSASQSSVFACLATNGCVISTMRDDYNMKRDGRMEKAMEAGRDNMEAFKAMQNGQHASTLRAR